MKDPFQLFQDWYQQELSQTNVRIPSACCLSTIGTDGYPNARFVSMKEIRQDAFVVTGPLDARKGQEIANIPKVSLTFWWTETEKQVRVQGDAVQLSESEASAYFAQRNQDSKIVSQVFQQGAVLNTLNELEERFQKGKQSYRDQNIEKPKSWSGFYIQPKRIEFMDFKENRLHQRMLYSKEDTIWKVTYLAP